MKTTGLLWFDDDPRRPVVAKIADAVDRFRERVGIEPTICEVNPAQLATTAPPEPKKRQRRTQAAKQPEIILPKKLQLVPSEQIYPNYFMLGTESEEALAPLWRRIGLDYDAPMPTRRKPRAARAPKTEVKEAPAPKVKIVAEALLSPKVRTKAIKTAQPKAETVATVTTLPIMKAPPKATPVARVKKGAMAKEASAAPAVTPRVRKATATKLQVVGQKTPGRKTKAETQNVAATVKTTRKAPPTPKTKKVVKAPSNLTTQISVKKGVAPKGLAVTRHAAAPKVRAVRKEAAASKVLTRTKKTAALDVAVTARKTSTRKAPVAVKQHTSRTSKPVSKQTPKPKAKVTTSEAVIAKPKTTLKARPATKRDASAKQLPAPKSRAARAVTPISRAKSTTRADAPVKPVKAASKPEALPVAKPRTQRVKRSA